jgi:branched-chain amino acid transport system permease protein
VVWPIALLCCGLLGAAVGYLALRTRGVQFIMITLAFAQLVYFVLMSLQIYGGDDGLMMQQRNTLPGLNLDAPTPSTTCAWRLWPSGPSSAPASSTRASAWCCRRCARASAAPSTWARRPPLPAGCLRAVGHRHRPGRRAVGQLRRAGHPDMAAWTKSGELMAMVILGGAGTLLGPIGGAAVFLGLEQTLAAWTEHWMLVMGPVLVLVVLAGKNGLFGRWLGASMAPEIPLLQVRGLRKAFGAVRATDGVDLELRQGEIHALIGPNGAGKST